MLTKDDVLILAKAGFTAAQIAALSETQKPAETPIEAPAEAAAEKPIIKKVEIKKPAEEKPVEAPANDALANKIDELIKTVQGININNSQQPKQESTDSILAAIINPPTNN